MWRGGGGLTGTLSEGGGFGSWCEAARVVPTRLHIYPPNPKDISGTSLKGDCNVPKKCQPSGFVEQAAKSTWSMFPVWVGLPPRKEYPGGNVGRWYVKKAPSRGSGWATIQRTSESSQSRHPIVVANPPCATNYILRGQDQIFVWCGVVQHIHFVVHFGANKFCVPYGHKKIIISG